MQDGFFKAQNGLFFTVSGPGGQIVKKEDYTPTTFPNAAYG